MPFFTASRVVLGRVDEQATTEQVLPGSLCGHFHGQVVIFRRAYMHVGNEVLLRVVEGLDASPQGIELVGRELAVDRAPGNSGLGGRLFNDETVDWRAAGAVTGANNQSAGIGKLAFTAIQGFFYQIINTQIGVHGVIGLRHEVPRRPVAECAPNVFVVESRALLPRKKWAGLCQKSPKRVGSSRRNGDIPSFRSEFTCAEPF